MYIQSICTLLKSCLVSIENCKVAELHFRSLSRSLRAQNGSSRPARPSRQASFVMTCSTAIAVSSVVKGSSSVP